MNLRSHTLQELLAGLDVGENAYELDTGSDGLDDVLLGKSEAECWRDVADWQSPIPEHWTLTEITRKQLMDHYA